ncbi:MAG: GNAT family N-acetyltransferase [candidate division Zixibacteria bacterium]|nr:GNAT family N-acetyltransferase [candidate division Zixibacteria bacterium]
MNDTSSDHRQITIRTMRIDEIKLLHALWDAAQLEYRPRGRDSREKLQDEWMANSDGFIAAFLEDRMVGCVLATDDGRRGWINRLAVHPDFRRGGLAGGLIAAAERELHRRGVRVIAALIDRENTLSQKLFEKSGYHFHKDIMYFSKRESDEV